MVQRPFPEPQTCPQASSDRPRAHRNHTALLIDTHVNMSAAATNSCNRLYQHWHDRMSHNRRGTRGRVSKRRGGWACRDESNPKQQTEKGPHGKEKLVHQHTPAAQQEPLAVTLSQRRSAPGNSTRCFIPGQLSHREAHAIEVDTLLELLKVGCDGPPTELWL